jgi:hypothetical protein
MTSLIDEHIKNFEKQTEKQNATEAQKTSLGGDGTKTPNQDNTPDEPGNKQKNSSGNTNILKKRAVHMSLHGNSNSRCRISTHICTCRPHTPCHPTTNFNRNLYQPDAKPLRGRKRKRSEPSNRGGPNNT